MSSRKIGNDALRVIRPVNTADGHQSLEVQASTAEHDAEQVGLLCTPEWHITNTSFESLLNKMYKEGDRPY